MAEVRMKEIKTFNYVRPAVQKGYTGQTLYVNLADSNIVIKPVTPRTKEIFVGGKGYDLWLLWNAVKNTTRWNDPENELCISSGPWAALPSIPGPARVL